MVAVRLPAELEKELSSLAADTGRSKSYYMVEALKRYLEDMEDRFTLEKAMKEFYEGDQKTYTTDEIAKELGIDL
jgi:RHH-type rel operon transcriptional repressor/antitoxin RelB